jgi:ribonuclease HI
MSLLSWNCHGFKHRVSDFRDLINHYQPACIAVQETYLSDTKTAKIRRYTTLRKDYVDGDRASGGVALFISHDYPYSPLTLQTDLQAIAARIQIHTLITVCCIYLPPNIAISQHSLNSLVDQLPTPFIIMGDLNGHNPIWGSPDVNHRGRQVEKLLSDHDLCLFNTNEITYFHSPSRTYHSIDLSICSPQIRPFWSFTVDPDLHDSDHFPIILTHTISNSNQRISRYILDSADWKSFRNLANITVDMVMNNPINEAVRLVTCTIISAADATIRKSSTRPRKQTKPWWDENCKKTYKEKRKAFCIFKRYPTTENFTVYKKTKAIFRRTLRLSQRDSWRNYVSSISSTTSSKQVWDKVRRCSGVYPNTQIHILKHNNQTISSVNEIANTIASTLAQISSSDNYQPSFKRIKTIAEKSPIDFSTNLQLHYNTNFTHFELDRAFKSTHKSSSGPDNISYAMLKNLSSTSLSNLLLLFNRIWQEHTFPTSWRMAVVIPILKPGKDPTNPLSYRPIALTNCMCKILEKMVNNRLIYYLEKNNCLSKHQSGFRRGRCTIDNIVDLERRVRNAFVKRNHLVAVFFDIEKAYDRTWRYGILKNLFNHDLRGNLPIFIQNFLLLRHFKVRIGNTVSENFIQEEGVPQGSVLSVTLFIVAINDILNQIPFSVSGNLYVDDLHISCAGTNMNFIERQLQRAINKIVKWSGENGFTLCPSKTYGVHFCRKRGLHPDPEILFAGVTINMLNEVKFLGVVFDRKLTFLPHILYTRKKCEKALNIIKVLSSTSWGADRGSLLKIYKSIILSRLDYGSEVYGSARKSVLNRLNTVHHSGLRLCSGAFRTSPVESLYVDCCEAPLNFRRMVLSLRYFFRISSIISHPLHNHSFSSYLTRLYHSRPSCIKPFHQRTQDILPSFNLDNTEVLVADFNNPPWKRSCFKFLNPFTPFNKDCTPDVIYQQLFKNHREKYRKYISVFTDGSKSENYVGCSFVIDNYTYSFKLHTSFSVFSAEVLAIYKALEYIELDHRRNFIIYTDSLSALQSLSYNNCHSSPLIFNILKFLDKLSSLGFTILFCWVPSHVGIDGNELADNAAKSASCTFSYPVPYDDIKKYVNKHVHKIWQESWDCQLTNKLHSVKQGIEIWPSMASRRHDVALTRLRIGHTRYTHGHLLVSELVPTCPKCKVATSVKHILIDCPQYRNYRVHCFHSDTVSLDKLLGATPHFNLFNFLKKIGFYPYI